MNNPVIIFGAGTLGKAALDIFNENNILVYGLLDDKVELAGAQIGSTSVIGQTEDEGILKLIGKKTEAFVAIRNKEDRMRLAKVLQKKNGVMPINAVHKNACVSEDASMGHGNLLGANTVIGAFSVLGNMNILGSAVIIDVGVKLADNIEIGSGSILNSKVNIEDGVFIGSNVTVVSGISIGKNARIGAGSVLIENVAENATVFGNPAKVVS